MAIFCHERLYLYIGIRIGHRCLLVVRIMYVMPRLGRLGAATANVPLAVGVQQAMYIAI